eukprot:TRINITY_DN4982_c0_g1_i1.p1 TRINITY_DN4982_c0_g1~~TRINITY_DN4982_c0_g1_i1.p1  ORF type:complete len:147 (+),score=46.44 TRINITY_DN4982_c0_g1_i1:64-504(+)
MCIRDRNKSIIRSGECERELNAIKNQVNQLMFEKGRAEELKEEEERRHKESINQSIEKLKVQQLNIEETINERNQWIDHYKEAESTIINMKREFDGEKAEIVNQLKLANEGMESLRKRCGELNDENDKQGQLLRTCLLYTSPSPRD